MNNKFQIIETDNYWLAVSNELIKKGDWCINPIGYLEVFGYGYQASYTKEDILSCNKIIAYRPKGNAPELDGVDWLPKIIVDIEKLAKNSDKSKCKHFEFIQSLKQPKPKWFIAKMEEVAKPMPNIHVKTWELKTTTNEQGQKALIGKYE